jgi:hypothetical protein
MIFETRGGRSALASGALVLFAAVAAGMAGAAEAPDERGPVSSLISDAVTEYQAGHFEEARALFLRANQQSPSARTLRGLGMASFELRDYVAATRALAAALHETRHPLTLEQRRHAEGLLARAETFVGRLTPRLQPAEATLMVDDKPAEREPDGTLLLPFGRHRITAGCPTCADDEREIEVLGGERRELEIALATRIPPAIAATPLAPATTDAASPPLVQRPAPPARHDTTAYWLAGGAAAAAAGAVAGGLWWRDRADALDSCRAAGDRCLNETAVTRERGLAVGLTIGLGAAGVAAGIAAAWLWPGASGGPSQAMACLAGKAALSCAIRF